MPLGIQLFPRLALCQATFKTTITLRNRFTMTQRPPITISSLDAVRLERLFDSLRSNQSPNMDDLQAELDRAHIVEPREIPPDVVTMNSTVTFRVESSDKEFSLTLVYPNDAGDSSTKISILAPVGSALLGLREGDEISWPKPGGGLLLVRILKVMYQPERSGDFQL